ncbi:MAG: hypothetical protein AB1571_01135 [Nanoarchaeota archaeon]
MKLEELYNMMKIRYGKDVNSIAMLHHDFNTYFYRKRTELKKTLLSYEELNYALSIICDIAKDDWGQLEKYVKEFDKGDPFYFAEKYELYTKVHKKFSGTSMAKTIVAYNLFKKRFNDQRELHGKKPVPFSVLDRILTNLIDAYSLFSTFAADVFKLEKGEGKLMEFVKQDNLEDILLNNKK